MSRKLYRIRNSILLLTALCGGASLGLDYLPPEMRDAVEPAAETLRDQVVAITSSEKFPDVGALGGIIAAIGTLIVLQRSR